MMGLELSLCRCGACAVRASRRVRAGQRAVLCVVRLRCRAVLSVVRCRAAPEADEVDSVHPVAGGREGGHVAPPMEARGAEAMDEQKGLPILRASRDVVDSERRRLAPV